VPNIKSAIKRVGVNEKKSERNHQITSKLATAVKKFNAAIDTNNAAEAERLLPLTFSVIDDAASKGVIHANAAARKKAHVATRLSDLKSGKIVIAAKVDNKTRIAEKRAKEEAERKAQKAASEAARAERQAAKAAAAAPVDKKAAKEKAKDAKKAEKPVAEKPVKEAKKKA
jgi:small subunit ribosomal protein S20